MLSNYKKSFDLLHDAVLIVDRHMMVRYANPSSEDLFGYSEEALTGSSIEMLVPVGLREAHRRHTDEYLQAPRAREMRNCARLSARRNGGSEFPVSISLNKLDCDQETMFCTIVRDLSEYVQMQDELLQKKKMESLGGLVGGVAHDINNVMAAIRGSIYLARRKPEQIDRHLNTIDSQCEYASEIVQQMLVVAKDESIETTDFSLPELLTASKRLFMAAASHDVNLSFEVGVRDAFVHGSPTLVNQAVINLILNARDAVEKQECPSISVKLHKQSLLNRGRSDSSYLCLSVADNGHGMDQSTVDRIFEPFYTTKPATKGTGLGLAIVYNVAQICGGFVDVESSVGQGSTFKLYLPMVENHEPAEPSDSFREGDEYSDEIGILLAEDNKAVRRVNRDIIESLGHTLYSAKNGNIAVKKANLFVDEIRLIVMDLSMPGMGGLAAAREIRRAGNQVPVIFCSGNSDFFKPVLEQADQLEPFTILTKPFTPVQLNRKIYELLQATENHVPPTTEISSS